MTSKNNINYPPLFASGHYYSEKDFQFTINTVNQTVTKTTALKNNKGITLMYFRSEQGSIIVNSKTYQIQRGLLICLGSYHYYQIKPYNGNIELVQCNLNYDTFMYMAANPYYKFSEITLNIQPLNSLLEGDMLERTEIVIEELIDATNKREKNNKANAKKNIDQRGSIIDNFPNKSSKTEFLLCMRLMGILQKNLSR